MEKGTKRYIQRRNTALKRFVLTGKYDCLAKFMRDYHITAPENKKIMEAGLYKATVHCAGIPDEVKEIARRKCIELGFNPEIEALETWKN